MKRERIVGPFPPIVLGSGTCPTCKQKRGRFQTEAGEGPGGIFFLKGRWQAPRWWPEELRINGYKLKERYGTLAAWITILKLCADCWQPLAGSPLPEITKSSRAEQKQAMMQPENAWQTY